jgi:tetratricopeptide (TPR) repeat protein
LGALAALSALCISAHARPVPSTWKLGRTRHFELYSQGGEAAARSALTWFEQLRAFFQQQTGLNLDGRPPVRVIAFRSASEYRPYRLRSTSDAYYLGTETRDYIVMPNLDAGEFATAAHEYAHLILHASGLQLPLWLNEGLAEFFSTLRIGDRGWNLGGDLPARSQVLRRNPWIPLSQLLTLPAESPLRENRDKTALFYAQSWKLTEMLLLSPQYAPRVQALIAALTSGTPSLRALEKVYAKPLDTIAEDVRAWTATGHKIRRFAGLAPETIVVEVGAVPALASRSLIAELLLAIGELDRAKTLYHELAQESPTNPDFPAALGTIALRKGDHDEAFKEWKRAMDHGISDATICYRYATLAGDVGLSANEIRPALQRAITLKPDFEDARYTLALLESNAGHYDTAVTQLRAMRSVAPARAYAYWSALAYALNELGKPDESIAAAQHALEHASTPAERSNAAQLAYIAQTDLAVQFTQDANGHTRLVTTRVPHKTADWNPFIEPGDKIHRIEAKLRELNCSDGRATGIAVDTVQGPLRLTIPDALHVLMRNAPSEFTCGTQPANAVMIEYAASETQDRNADGVLRGMAFQSSSGENER